MRVHLFGSLFTVFTYHVPPRRAGITGTSRRQDQGELKGRFSTLQESVEYTSVLCGQEGQTEFITLYIFELWH